jgi:GH15 family glucan-1,4-alpha-glucosidase
MDGLPIGEYALLSDCHSAGLVSRDGSVDWLCVPRFDAPSVFCRLLDPAGGHFSIRPAGEFEVSRRYLDQTMVLETTFRTAGGTAVLTDALATGRDERGHHLGIDSPGALLRSLTCTEGEIEAKVSYAPRPEYGLVHPILFRLAGGVLARGGASRLFLSTSVRFALNDASATATVRLTAGQTAEFALAHGYLAGAALSPWAGDEITSRLADTVEGWRSWSAIHQNYEGPWQEQVHHSGRVLQAMTFAPTGAIVAAPTTSLPETVGGGRNWDYRYTWVRDASLTGWRPARTRPASSWLSWPTRLAPRSSTTPTCRSCSASGASETCRSGNCPTWRAGGRAARSGSATTRGCSGSSTCTVSCSAPRAG